MKPWLQNLANLLDAPNGAFRKSYSIPRGSGRRLVITDIHGCYLTFEALLEKIGLNRDDQLFILGDFVNRGPFSNLVLDRVIDLLEAGYEIYPLRGNHEQAWLQYDKKGRKQSWGYGNRQNSLNLLNDDLRLRKRYSRLFNAMPYYYKTDRAYLVHAGFDFRSANPMRDFPKMLQIRNYPVDAERLGGRVIVHGHNPTPISRIEWALESGSHTIPLDNGCVWRKRGAQYGQLLCLDLDRFELWKQPYSEKASSWSSYYY